MPHKILRLPGVEQESGHKRSTLYSLIKDRLWTKPIKLSPRCVGWPAHEVSALNAARISCKSDDQIRKLVIELESARKSAKGQPS